MLPALRGLIMQHPGEIVHLLSLFARFADVWEASSTRIFTIVAEGQKECGSWWCKRGLSVLTVVCANYFLLTELETFQSFWNISDPLFLLFRVEGKWCHLVSFYMLPFPSVLVYPSNLTIITMTSTLWTSFNSKKMLTKHLNDARRCKKNDAYVDRNLPTVAAILFPYFYFKEACWLYKFLQYRGCIVGLLRGCSLRHYSWW